jgi:ferrous iron transport protein A
MTATLSDVRIGRTAVVRRVTATGPDKRRLLELGVLPGVSVKLERIGPLGEPLIVGVRGRRLSLRRCEAEQVQVDRPQ